MQNKRTRHLALLICLCFIFVFLFSLTYITVEANHDCTGENCPICACIHSAERTLQQMGSGVMLSFLVISSLITILSSFISRLPIFPCTTPVSQKIRMNN